MLGMIPTQGMTGACGTAKVRVGNRPSCTNGAHPQVQQYLRMRRPMACSGKQKKAPKRACGRPLAKCYSNCQASAFRPSRWVAIVTAEMVVTEFERFNVSIYNSLSCFVVLQ